MAWHLLAVTSLASKFRRIVHGHFTVMINALHHLALAGLLLALSGVLHAGPIYNTGHEPGSGHNTAGGTVSGIDATFDTNTDTFSWKYDIVDPSARTHDGFWLVVNDGVDIALNPYGNPKGETGLAILYGDLVAGDISAYVYNGGNNANSYTVSDHFIGFFEDVINVTADGGTRTVDFSIPVNALNSTRPGRGALGDATVWEGVQFGPEQLGIWFHTTSSSNAGGPASYVANGGGRIDAFRVNGTGNGSGWVDTGGLAVSDIPEPGMLMLSVMGLAAFGASRRLSRQA